MSEIYGKKTIQKKNQKKNNTENKNETEETKQNKPMYNERVRLWKAALPICFFSFLLFLIIFIVDALNKCPGFVNFKDNRFLRIPILVSVTPP